MGSVPYFRDSSLHFAVLLPASFPKANISRGPLKTSYFTRLQLTGSGSISLFILVPVRTKRLEAVTALWWVLCARVP